MFNIRNLRRRAITEDSPYALIFDINAIFFDLNNYYLTAWQKVLAEKGITKPLQEIADQCIGKNEQTVLHFWGEKLNEQEVDRIAQRQAEMLLTLYKPRIRLIEGVKRFLDDSQANNIALATVSDSSLNVMDCLYNEANLKSYFKVIVGAEDVDRGKPYPDLVLKAALRLGIMPEECISFESSETGLQASLRASVKAFLVQPHAGKVSIDYPNLIQKLADYRMLRPTLVLAYSQKISL